VFDQWNQGELQSYLIEITARRWSRSTPTPAAAGRPDRRQGRPEGHRPWTLINAAENAVVVSTINAAVEARVLSSMRALRVVPATQLQGPAGHG
jgi:6-phosphogluconate dehydrogenase